MVQLGAPKRVVVVGAGLSGLSAAWHLSKVSPSTHVCLIEESERVGGWVHTLKKKGRGEGAIVHDTGPHSVRSGVLAYDTCELVSQCGIADKAIVAEQSTSGAKRYIYTDGKLHSLPTGFSDLLTRGGVFGRGLLQAAIKEISISKRNDIADESVHHFAKRRFGLEVAENLFGAMVHGIYAGDYKTLSLRACFPILHKIEQASGSVVKGMLTGSGTTKKEKHTQKSQFKAYDATTQDLISKLKGTTAWGLEGGMESLVIALRDKLVAQPNVDLQLSTNCLGIDVRQDGVKVHVSSPSSNIHTLEADHIISSVPSYKMPGLLSIDEIEGHGSGSLAKMNEIFGATSFANVAVVNLAYDEDVLPIKGFGYLVPPKEKSEVLGVIFDSCVFPSQNGGNSNVTRLTVMMRGDRFKQKGIEDEKILSRMALTGIREHLGITATPTHVLAQTQRNCIPHYQPGHVARMGELDWLMRSTFHGRLSVIGASYKGVSVNDCIRFAKCTALGLASGRTVTGLSVV
eukprot:CFRG5627T1